mmetsp:Transcript_91908/g.281229  ORF Transcript_91908/g.281229 Transcript_91908/m.281229 type:complete len:110 (-) Transcript_91908:101-430(-)
MTRTFRPQYWGQSFTCAKQKRAGTVEELQADAGHAKLRLRRRGVLLDLAGAISPEPLRMPLIRMELMLKWASKWSENAVSPSPLSLPSAIVSLMDNIRRKKDLSLIPRK